MINHSLNSNYSGSLVSGDFASRTIKAVKKQLNRLADVVKVLIATHPAYSSKIAWL